MPKLRSRLSLIINAMRSYNRTNHATTLFFPRSFPKLCGECDTVIGTQCTSYVCLVGDHVAPPGISSEPRKATLSKRRLFARYCLYRVHQKKCFLPITNMLAEPVVLQSFVADIGDHISCSSVASLEYSSEDRLPPDTALDLSVLEEMISQSLDATSWQQLCLLRDNFLPFLTAKVLHCQITRDCE